MTGIHLSNYVPLATVEPVSTANAVAPTVASLGIQVHLVPMDVDRERDLACLMASCDALRAECERLVRQVQDLLGEGARDSQSVPRPSPE